jgi:hypothetical protein
MIQNSDPFFSHHLSLFIFFPVPFAFFTSPGKLAPSMKQILMNLFRGSFFVLTRPPRRMQDSKAAGIGMRLRICFTGGLTYP